MTVEAARAVADAVLYEGYLLYPYRASAAKNRSRWQFGVLGPPSATSPAFAEGPAMAMRCLLHSAVRGAAVTIHLRFLQLQSRLVERRTADGSLAPTDALTVADETVLTWDEAVEHEFVLTAPLSPPALSGGTLPADPPSGLSPRSAPTLDPSPRSAPSPPKPLQSRTDKSDFPVFIPGGVDEELLGEAGRIIRRRWPLTARVRVSAEPEAGAAPDRELLRLTVTVTNEHPGEVSGKEEAIRHSLLGAHLLLEAQDAAFVSMQDPPPEAVAAAARCHQERCWPVLAGSDRIVLGAPIILYDHPTVAQQSPGALFDATEIDEILTLRVMTMTDEEKAEARATDPRARTIVDRCDALTPADLQRLHGTRLDDTPWWDPAADAEADPSTDSVVIAGVPVSRGSLVRVHPSRRADAQDLFFAGQVARVTAVLSDVDGGTHVALVLVDDPAADLHDWYGRYLYFAPDELEPLAERS